MNWPVGPAITRSSLEREVQGSNLGSVKLNTVLPTARHCCYISSKRAATLPVARCNKNLPARNNVEMGPADSLHISA